MEQHHKGICKSTSGTNQLCMHSIYKQLTLQVVIHNVLSTIFTFNALLTFGLRSPYFWHKEHCLSSSLDHPVSKSAFESRPLFPIYTYMYKSKDLNTAQFFFF